MRVVSQSLQICSGAGRAGEGLAELFVPLPAPGPGGVQAFAAEEADPELEPPSRGEEPQPPPAQVGGSGPRLLSRPGVDSGRGVQLREAASGPGPRAVAGGAGG